MKKDGMKMEFIYLLVLINFQGADKLSDESSNKQNENIIHAQEQCWLFI